MITKKANEEIEEEGHGKAQPEPVPPSPVKSHRRVYQVGAMRFLVKEAPLRDSPRGKLVAKYKEILKKGKKPASSSANQDADTYEPPRKPAASRPSRQGLPIGFPRFRQEDPEPHDDDDED